MSATPAHGVPEKTAGAGLAAAPESLPPASLPRRLAAMLYDSLLLLALLMIVTAFFLPFTGGEAVRWQAFPLLTLLYWCALAGAVLVYFGLPWTARGQTLAMTTWRLRVQRDDGCLLTWRDVAVRLSASLLSWLPAGLGFIWVLFDRERRAWHDALSGTRVVVLPKRPRRAKRP
jgi:uncharacterized RDD family membrane protein YckC